MLHAAISGALDGITMIQHPVFRVMVPTTCPGVPSEVLDARGMWADPVAYDRSASHLSGLFNDNFKKFESVDREIAEAAPAS